MVFKLAVFVIAITGLAFLAMQFPKYKRVQLDNGYGERIVKLPNAFIVIAIAVLLIGISGHRGFGYQDTAEYVWSYTGGLSDDINQSNSMFNENWGFWKFSLIIKNATNTNVSWYLLWCSIVTVGLIIWVFRKYSERFEITLFFFFVFGSYLTGMNAMRQCLASAIMFCGYRFFMNKKWLLFFALVAIAYTFHSSSIVMVPIYFFCHRPAWQPLATGVVVAVVGALVFVPSFTNTLFSLMGDSDYSKYESLHGANIIRPVIMSVVCLVAFINRKKIHERYPASDALVNMLIVHTVILFASTNSWVIARLAMFTDLYVEMLIPMMIIACFDKKDRSAYVVVVMLFFFAYHLYEYRGLAYYSATLGINV